MAKRMLTRKELSQVYFLNKELKMREKQLNDLIMASQVSSKAPDGMPYSHTNGISDKVAETAVKIIEYTEEVNVYKEALEIRKMAIDRWIMSLEDSYLRQIIYYRCIDLMTWDKIAEVLGGTSESIKKYFYRHIP